MDCNQRWITDDSEKIIRNFEGGGFPIYYHYQTNQGKHIAQNHALDVARGELFLPLDSDDTVVDDAVETIVNEWNKIKSRLDFAEYSGLLDDPTSGSYLLNIRDWDSIVKTKPDKLLEHLGLRTTSYQMIWKCISSTKCVAKNGDLYERTL